MLTGPEWAEASIMRQRRRRGRRANPLRSEMRGPDAPIVGQADSPAEVHFTLSTPQQREISPHPQLDVAVGEPHGARADGLMRLTGQAPARPAAFARSRPPRRGR